jgi:hypothetical protein
VSDAPRTPGDALRILFGSIRSGGIAVEPSYVAEDLANLRRACPNDGNFSAAVLAVAKEIQIAAASPSTHGVAVQHDLQGWRRSKFASKTGGEAHLRLVFRGAKGGGMDVLAFGDRDFPDTIYYTAKRRR